MNEILLLVVRIVLRLVDNMAAVPFAERRRKRGQADQIAARRLWFEIAQFESWHRIGTRGDFGRELERNGNHRLGRNRHSTYEEGTISESAQRIPGGISQCRRASIVTPRRSELAVLADLHAKSYRSLDAGGQREFWVYRLPAPDEVLGGALRGNVDPGLRPGGGSLGIRKCVRQKHYH